MLLVMLVVTGCPKKQAKTKSIEEICKEEKSGGPAVKQVSTLNVPFFGRSFNLSNFVRSDSNNSEVSQLRFSLRSVPPGFNANIQGGNLTLKPNGESGADPAKAPEGTVEIEAKDGCGKSETISLNTKQSTRAATSELFTGIGGSPPSPVSVPVVTTTTTTTVTRPAVPVLPTGSTPAASTHFF